MKVSNCIKFVCVLQWLKKFSLFNFPAWALAFCLKHSRFRDFPNEPCIYRESVTILMLDEIRLINDKICCCMQNILCRKFPLFLHLKNEIYSEAEAAAQNFLSVDKNQNLHLQTFPPLHEEFFRSNWRATYMIYYVLEIFWWTFCRDPCGKERGRLIGMTTSKH